jgi:hypothetical protein
MVQSEIIPHMIAPWLLCTVVALVQKVVEAGCGDAARPSKAESDIGKKK